MPMPDAELTSAKNQVCDAPVGLLPMGLLLPVGLL